MRSSCKAPGTLYGVFAILAIGGAIFPLVGASLIAMLLLDRLLSRRTTT